MANSWEFLVGEGVDLVGLELRSHNLYLRTYVDAYCGLAYSSYVRADCGLAYSSELETNTVNTFIT